MIRGCGIRLEFEESFPLEILVLAIQTETETFPAAEL